MAEMGTDRFQNGSKEQVMYLINKWKEDCNKVQFRDNVVELVVGFNKIPYSKIPPVEERKHVIEMIAEAYFDVLGEYPKPHVLNGLGDYMLIDYIKNVSKSKSDPHSFHTKHQLKRRLSKEFSTMDDKMDYLNSKRNLNMSSLHKKTVKQVD